MTEIDPISYFSTIDINESLVLGLTHQRLNGSVDLIIRYAADLVSKAVERQLEGLPPLTAAESPSDFRHFQFHGISEFDAVSSLRSFPNGSELTINEEFIQSKPRILTEVHHARVGRDYLFEGNLVNICQVKFYYQRLLVESRVGVGVARDGGRWDYYDLRTGQAIDFFKPFESTQG
jgi:hypothetical protein